MKKMLILISWLIVLAGCTTLSSIYDGAKPNKVVQNGDGSTTFEFLFKAADYDATMAGQRVQEYIDRYVKENGFSGYDIITVSGKSVEKTSGVAAALSVVAAGAEGAAGKDYTPMNTRRTFIRLLVEVKFKS